MDKSKKKAAGKKGAASIEWNRDRIHNISMSLSSANRVWYEQAFGTPTDERTLEIVGKLDDAAELLDELREELRAACGAALV